MPASELRIDFDELKLRRQRELAMVKRMASYAYHEGCRRAFLLAYFGDRGGSCSGCDVCDGPREAPSPEELAAPGRKRKSRDRRAAVRVAEGGDAGPPPPEAPFDAGVFEALKRLRSTLAKSEGVPPYVVFHDKTLKELARSLPTTRDAFVEVHGIGPAKWDRYGPHVIAAIAQALQKSA